MRYVFFVGHQDDGVPGGVELVDKVHDFVAGASIQRARWFVGQNDGGVVDQSTSHGNALPLPTRKFVGAVIHAVAQAYRFECLGGLLASLPAGQAAVDQREFDVAQGV